MSDEEYEALSADARAAEQAKAEALASERVEAESRSAERARLEAQQARAHYDAGFNASMQMADACISNALRLDPRNPPQLPIAQAALARQMVLEMHYLVATAGQIMHNLNGIGGELNAIVGALDALGDKSGDEKPVDPTTLAEVFKEPVVAVASAVARKGKSKSAAKPA